MRAAPHLRRVRHRRGGARVVERSHAVLQAAHAVGRGAGVQPLVVVPAEPDERLGALRRERGRRQEVGRRVGALQLVVLDAALPGQHSRRRVTLGLFTP